MYYFRVFWNNDIGKDYIQQVITATYSQYGINIVETLNDSFMLSCTDVSKAFAFGYILGAKSYAILK